jgi:hypothetical protein
MLFVVVLAHFVVAATFISDVPDAFDVVLAVVASATTLIANALDDDNVVVVVVTTTLIANALDAFDVVVADATFISDVQVTLIVIVAVP